MSSVSQSQRGNGFALRDCMCRANWEKRFRTTPSCDSGVSHVRHCRESDNHCCENTPTVSCSSAQRDRHTQAMKAAELGGRQYLHSKTRSTYPAFNWLPRRELTHHPSDQGGCVIKSSAASGSVETQGKAMAERLLNLDLRGSCFAPLDVLRSFMAAASRVRTHAWDWAFQLQAACIQYGTMLPADRALRLGEVFGETATVCRCRWRFRCC